MREELDGLEIQLKSYLEAVVDVDGSEHIVVEPFIRDIEDIREIHLKIEFGADFGIDDVFDNKEQEQADDRSK